jgi:hypothetical protein
MTEQKEAAAQIEVRIGSERIVVADLDTRTEIDVERLYGSGSVLPEGFAVKKIEHTGSATLNGNKLDLNSVLFYQPTDTIPEGADVGTPKPATLTILHMDGTTTDFYEVMVVNRGFEFASEEVAQTSYEWIAMGSSDDPVV